MVLAHVFNKLSHLVNILTIQIIKDEWTRINPVSTTIGSSRTTLQDFTSGVSTPKSQFKSVASSLPAHMANNTLYGAGNPYSPTPPLRAQSTPYGTPLKDISFNSDMDNVPSHDVPSPVMADAKLKGILRTNPSGAYGGSRQGQQFSRNDWTAQSLAPLGSGSAVIDFSTLGTGNTFPTSTNSRTNVRR